VVNPGALVVTVMPRPQLWGASDEIVMKGQAMSLIRNGYAVSICRSFLLALFPALFSLALCDHGALRAQDIKQIKLTEKHIQGFIAADDEMARIYGANVDNSDPKVRAQGEAVARKNGFASLAEYDDVSMNIAILMSHIDPHRASRTGQGGDRGAQGGQISLGGRKERSPGGARNGAQGRQAYCVQGEYHIGDKVFR
jgi:hypothetical protein